MYSEKFDEALTYASQLHRSQFRKCSQTPYITHLLAVASIVGEHGGSEAEVIAALLHDAIEDQGGAPTREEIRQRFGDEVAQIVEACSDTDVVPKPPWRKRKEAYLGALSHHSPSAHLVCAADKLHNCRCLVADLQHLGDALWERFNGGKDGTLWYYQAVVETLTGRAPERLVSQLQAAVRTLCDLAEPIADVRPAPLIADQPSEDASR